MAFESLSLLKAVCAALRADAELADAFPGGVWFNLAPQGTPFPYLVINMTTQVDSYGNGAVRLFTEPFFRVDVLSEGTSPAPVLAGVNRLDEVLSAIRQPVDDLFIHSVTRQGGAVFSYLEVRDDQSDTAPILHLISTYRAFISAIQE